MKRRTMLAGLLGGTVAVARGELLRAQNGQRADLAGCLAEPGIALYLDLFEGRAPLTFEELLPGTDWRLFSSPYALVSFLYPPDWSAQELSASTFTQRAAPIWTTSVPQPGGLLSARVVAPDASALWEYVAGTLQGVAVSIEQAIAIAEGGVLGDEDAGNRLCLYTEQTINGGTAWLTAVESNGLLVLTNGTLFTDASGFSPVSVITYYALAAPRASYEQVMRQVFLPIQWQLLRRSPVDLTPTATP